MRTVTINNIEYEINCNALTYLYYRKIFDKNVFDDINIVRDFLMIQLEKKSSDEKILMKLNSYIEAINRLTYSVIYTQNQNIEDYLKWIEKNQVIEQNNNCISIIVEDIIDCFIDSNVSKELERINKCSGNDEDVLFPEHHFLSACLKLGLTMKDLEILTYIDVLKIFLSFGTKKEEKSKYKEATQVDWDRLANSR